MLPVFATVAKNNNSYNGFIAQEIFTYSITGQQVNNTEVIHIYTPTKHNSSYSYLIRTNLKERNLILKLKIQITPVISNKQ